MTDDDILMGLEMAARAERTAGFDGWCQPPAGISEAVSRLVEAGFAEEQPGNPGWFRPTKKGAKRVGFRIHAVQ